MSGRPRTKLPDDQIISPYTNPAEVELIGILINRPANVRDAELMVADDFQEPRHWEALRVIRKLYAAGEEISPLTVAEAMDPKEKAEYLYLSFIAKERGFYTENFMARVNSVRRDAIDRACGRAAAQANWGLIVDLRAEYERLGKRHAKTLSAEELLGKDFPPLRWLVEGVLPEGTTLLAAPPKVGKTRLALQLSLALASGGYALNNQDTQCPATGVLYLALESGERRLQKDIRQLHESGPPNLHLATRWRRLAEGGSADLESFLDRQPDVTLIVMDTLAQVRSATHGDNGFLYSADYLCGASIKDLADKRGVNILIVHHTRKSLGDDPLDSVSGSYGVTGSVDHVLILQRKRMENDGTLSVISRDYPDNQWALSFVGGLWTLRGTPGQASADGWIGDGTSAERREILDLLRQEPMRPAELAVVLGKNPSTLRVLLMKLVEANKIYRRFDGAYAIVVDDSQKMH